MRPAKIRGLPLRRRRRESTQRPRPHSSPRRWRPPRWSAAAYLSALAFTLGFSYLALRGVRLGAAAGALQRSDYWWLLPALGALALASLTRALRWRCLFTAAQRPPLRAIGSAMMLGYLYNNILPGRAGEVARVVALRRATGLPALEITGTALLDRVYDVLGILIMFFCTQPWLPRVGWLGTVALTAGVAAAALLVGMPILALGGEQMLSRLLRPLARLPWLSEARLRRSAGELTRALSGLRVPRIALAALGWTLIGWLMSALVAYLLTIGSHLHLGFSAAVLVATAIGLAMILPAPPAAIGLFEGAVLLALHAFPVARSAALSYAMVLHLVNFAPLVLVGLLVLYLSSRHSRSRESGQDGPLATLDTGGATVTAPQPARGSSPA